MKHLTAGFFFPSGGERNNQKIRSRREFLWINFFTELTLGDKCWLCLKGNLVKFNFWISWLPKLSLQTLDSCWENSVPAWGCLWTFNIPQGCGTNISISSVSLLWVSLDLLSSLLPFIILFPTWISAAFSLGFVNLEGFDAISSDLWCFFFCVCHSWPTSRELGVFFSFPIRTEQVDFVLDPCV